MIPALDAWCQGKTVPRSSLSSSFFVKLDHRSDSFFISSVWSDFHIVLLQVQDHHLKKKQQIPFSRTLPHRHKTKLPRPQLGSNFVPFCRANWIVCVDHHHLLMLLQKAKYVKKLFTRNFIKVIVWYSVCMQASFFLIRILMNHAFFISIIGREEEEYDMNMDSWRVALLSMAYSRWRKRRSFGKKTVQ